jgi:UDP-N-acetylglucosamine acyltransferase
MHTTTIHPTAILSSETTLGQNVVIGPYCVLEGKITLGDGCVLAPYVHLVGELEVGARTRIGTGSVLGTGPQHLAWTGQPTKTVLGNDNTLREHVTIHGSYISNGETRIGDRNFLMEHSHVGHDALLGDDCILVNGALVAGHATLEDRVIMSGNSAVHQFGRLGKLCLLSGCTIATKDAPPFALMHSRNAVSGVNLVGMRRAGYEPKAISAVRKAYRILYHRGLTVKEALQVMEQELGEHEAIREILEFVRLSKRGIPGGHHTKRQGEANMAEAA